MSSTASQHHAPPRDNSHLQRRAQAAYGLVLALIIAASLGVCLVYWAACDGVC